MRCKISLSSKGHLAIIAILYYLAYLSVVLKLRNLTSIMHDNNIGSVVIVKKQR
jgi:hypothetical protein